MQTLELPASSTFVRIAEEAIDAVMHSPNPDLVAMATTVPIWASAVASPAQQQAAACTDCKVLGLWARDWPGYEQYPHGVIWLFEQGIADTAKKKGIAASDQTLETVIHELGHALGYEHGSALNSFVRQSIGVLR